VDLLVRAVLRLRAVAHLRWALKVAHLRGLVAKLLLPVWRVALPVKKVGAKAGQLIRPRLSKSMLSFLQRNSRLTT
jgi:hypothetical protein